MELIVFALIVSTVLLAIIYAISRSHWGVRGVLLPLTITTVLFFCLMSPPVFLQSLLTLIIASVCCAFRWGSKVLMPASVAAMVVSYALAFLITTAELNHRAALRVQYPVESLADRLAYEVPRSTPVQRAEGSTTVEPLNEPIEKELRRLEDRPNGSWRSYMLEKLHDRTVDEFVVAQGFGPVRMAGVGGGDIELPETKPIPLPPTPAYSPEVTDTLPLAAGGSDNVLPSKESLSSMHTSGLEDFLDKDRMGYVKDRDHVAGFMAHQFMKMPDLGSRDEPKAKWEIVRLELISLLKHKVPVAYQSKYLPKMDELREAPTRPLNQFEQQALPRLRSDEDLAVEETRDRIRMVGSLRAGKDCLSCHSVRRGELLGAFSYELVPMTPTPDHDQKDKTPKQDEL
jgi:hypothetical protein